MATPVHAQSRDAASTQADVTVPALAANWRAETNPDVAAFNAWAQKQADPRTAATDASAQVDGVALAKNRRIVLTKWMHSDPARALAAGVPAGVRAKLPAAVLGELESPFSATGNYTVRCEMRAVGGPGVSAEHRFIEVGGRTYTAHVYGRRLGITTKSNIFLHGFLLGDEAVLDENILRALPADEIASEPRAAKSLGSATTGGTVAEGGSRLYRFDSDEQLRQAEANLRILEAHRTAETSSLSEKNALEDPASIPAIPDSAYSTGNKKVLVIRVDFSDATGSNMTADAISSAANSQIVPYYSRSSYGLTSLTFTVAPKVYRMPRTASYYATNNDNSGLHTDAEAAAGADYNVAGFDRVCVYFNSLSQISGSQINYGGLGDVGGSRVWLNGSFSFRIVSHELGHTYGLQHGNLWQVTDGNPVSANGTSMEYGDEYETMGDDYTFDEEVDFNVWYKTILGWLPDSQVQTVTGDGTYRVYRSDSATHSGTLALRIPRDSARNYWVSVRRSFADNVSMSHGVYVIWGYNNNSTKENLLDMQTPGSSVLDAGLRTGTTFNDAVGQVSIAPLIEGGTSLSEYEDIKISFKPAAVPVISGALTANVQPGQSFNYQITASGHPTSYGASGLPSGLRVDTATGLISGTPSALGSFPITLQATNNLGTGTAVLTLTVATYNDNFADALVLTNAGGQTTANNAAATVEYGEPDPLSAGGRHSLWYSWTPTVSGQTGFTTYGSNFDTVMVVYTGTSLSALTVVAKNDDDDGGDGVTSHVNFTAQAGVTYRVSVDGFGGESGNIILNWATNPLQTPPFFSGEAALGNGAYYLSFSNGNYFGYYSYLADPNYLYHYDMGYEYIFNAADYRGGVYFYDFKSSTFFYTSPVFPFPYLYDFSLNTVLYYYPDPSNPGHYNTNGYRFFYRFDNGQIIVK